MSVLTPESPASSWWWSRLRRHWLIWHVNWLIDATSWSDSNCPGDVLFVVERNVGPSSQVGVEIVEIPGTSTWYSVLWIGASERELVEHGLIAAEEGPLLHVGGAIHVDHCVADVEDLTVVVDVSVVAVVAANERGSHCANDEFCTVWKVVGCSFGLLKNRKKALVF